MSRVILSRHDNYDEHVVVGWDRPLGHFFWSEFDSDGESIDESYIDRGLTPRTTEDFVNSVANNRTVFQALMDAIERGGKDDQPEPLVELRRHMTLDYPESNVTLDLSERK